MSARGIPVQDQPENQDPSVRHTIDQMTGQVTQWDEKDAKSEKPARKKPEPQKTDTKAAPTQDDPVKREAPKPTPPQKDEEVSRVPAKGDGK